MDYSKKLLSSVITESPRKTFRTVLPIVTIAFLLRLIVVALTFHTLPTSHHFEDFGAEMGWTARSLALGKGYASPFFPFTGPTALVPPLYPLLLAGIFRAFGVYSDASAFVALALNSFFSSLTVAVIFLGTRSRLGTRSAVGAAWLWALYPYAVYFSAAYLWDFALTSLLFAACFFLAITRLPQMRTIGWIGYGLLAGLAVLSNPSILPILMVLTLYAAWQRYRSEGSIVPRLILAMLCASMVLSPWLLRNYRVFHSPMLRSGFWGEFYAGNNGDTSYSNPGWTHPASNTIEMERYVKLGEMNYMEEKRQLSMAHVRSNPAQFVAISLRRIVRYWTGYWSFSRHYLADQALDLPNVPMCTLLTVLMFVGLWQTWQRSRSDALPYIAAFLLIPLPYYITHASVDYRQPLEPLVVVTVITGAQTLLERRKAFALDDADVALTDAA